MAQIGVTRETKAKLLAVATDGQGIETWMFQFISHDPKFQAELFLTAENAKNWRFLESLSDFRAEQRRAVSTAAASASARRFESPRNPHRVGRLIKPQRTRPKKHRQKARTRPPSPLSLPPFDPATLPSGRVIRVSSKDFTNCPRCKLRLLKKVLGDHLELSCPHRGRIDGPVVSASSEKQKLGNRIVYCICGAPAIPGDSCCYEHKHT